MSFRVVLTVASAVLLAAPVASAAPWYVAGDGVAGPDAAAGGPATAALTPRPVALAPGAGGSFLVGLEGGGVVRVDAHGVIAQVTKGIGAAGVAEMADGSVLVADGEASILKVTSDGKVARVAGTGKAGFAGDGGPAVSAQLSEPRAVAVQADGGYLVADSANNRIRRIAPDGTIATVAGTGTTDPDAGPAGPKPALSVNLFRPTDVAVLPDGGYVVADSVRGVIRRVDVAGMATIVAGTVANDPSTGIPEGADALTTDIGYPRHVAVGADGAIWFANGSAVVEIAAGKLHQPDASLSGDAVAIEPGGGVLAAQTSAGRVAWLAPAGATRLAVTIEPSVAHVGKRVKLRFATTRAAAAHVTLSLGSKTVYSTDRQATAGRNALTLPPTLKPGKLYRVTVSLTAADGSVATDRLPVFAGRTLPLGVARQVTRAVAALSFDPGNGDDLTNYDEFESGCTRVSAARVDCEVGSHVDDVVDCDHVLELLLGKDSKIRYRRYACPTRPHRKPKGPLSAAPRY